MRLEDLAERPPESRHGLQKSVPLRAVDHEGRYAIASRRLGIPTLHMQ